MRKCNLYQRSGAAYLEHVESPGLLDGELGWEIARQEGVVQTNLIHGG